MLKRLVILGAGGNAADILDIVDAINAVRPTWSVIGLLDDKAEIGSRRYGAEVVGRVADAGSLGDDTWFVNAIGSDASFAARRRIIEGTGISDDRFATLIHPQAGVGREATLSPGAYAAFGVSIGGAVTIGRHVHLGAGALLGHDCRIGDFALVAAGAVISGSVKIGDSAYVGAASSIKQAVTVGAGALIGMGAVVVGDVPPGAVVAGNPARPLERQKRSMVVRSA